jgi:hypothetical protein
LSLSALIPLGQLDDLGRNLLPLSALGRIEMVRLLQHARFGAWSDRRGLYIKGIRSID